MSAHPFRVSLAALLLGPVLVLVGACTQAQGHVPTPEDAKALTRLIRDVDTVNALVLANEALADKYAATKPGGLDRATLFSFWAPHLDHDRALLSYQHRFLDNWSAAGSLYDNTRSLALGMMALSAQVQSNLLFLERLGRSDALRETMNDAAPDYGVGSGEYDAILRRLALPQTMLTLQLGTDTLTHLVEGLRGRHITADQAFLDLADKSLALSATVDAAYQRSAARLMVTAINAATSQQIDALSSAIVTNIAEWLGDTRLRGNGQSLISADQVAWLQTQLQPGDVMVERRNWYLSNLGLPGFWPHTEMYVGTAAELTATFDSDPDVIATFGAGGLTPWLASHHPETWAAFTTPTSDGQPLRVLEAVSEGVKFSTMIEATQADYLGAMRPQLSTVARAQAIATAFAQIGKAYDFDFDFLTEAVLVCSEVVYVAYKPQAGVQPGLRLPLTTVMGRLTLPPNDIVQLFDSERDGPSPQFAFVAFLDGRESTGTALVATEADFRASWQRPKWDLSQL